MKNALMITALFVSMASVSQANESKKPEAQAVNLACASESTAANCGNEKVGTGLLKCLRKYKKENKDFKFSDGCKTAMQDLKKDRKERREKKSGEEKK